MIHHISRKSPYPTDPFSLKQKIRCVSGSTAFVCVMLIAGICASAWAKPGPAAKSATTSKAVPAKNQKALAGKNSTAKAPKNQDAKIGKPAALQDKKAGKKTVATAQLAKQNKSGKAAPAKQPPRLAESSVRSAKSSSIARNKKSVDTTRQTAGKTNRQGNDQEALTVRNLRGQIAALQASGKKRPLSKAQKQQLTQLTAQLRRAENTEQREARMQHLAAAKPGKQQANDAANSRQQYLQALARDAQSRGTMPMSSPAQATNGLQKELTALQMIKQENPSEAVPAAAPSTAMTIALSPSTITKEEALGTSTAAATTATELSSEAPPPVLRRSEPAPSPIVRVSIPQRDGLGQIQGLSEDRADFGPALHSNVAFVMDQNTGQVLVNKNGHNVSPIASITKLMTAVITMDANLPMDEMITITEEDVDRLKGSRSRLAVGTTLSRQELLHLALMSSENRAAHALGRSYPGGLSEAIRTMNMRALMLGMRETRYVEPTGLSSANRSSAHDLALLVKAAYRYPLIRNYTTYPGAEFPVQGQMMRFNNTNRLIHSPDWNIGLQKTGYISEAGRCVVMQSNISGRNVIIVLLDSAGTNRRVEDAEAIRYWVQQDTRPGPVRDGSSIVVRGVY